MIHTDEGNIRGEKNGGRKERVGESVGGRTGGSKGGATSAGLVGIDRRRREWERKMKQRTKS